MIIAYLPLFTTVFAVYFFIEIAQHWQHRRKAYLAWWMIGVATFGLGTLCESIHAIFGWMPWNAKAWYILGALLGGFPLAQGSVYLLQSKQFANATSIVFCLLIALGSVAVIASPLALPPDFQYQLTGKVLAWKWVRAISPFINTYAFLFLVGGAITSAMRYRKQFEYASFYKGNVLIAIGGLLPGIGGSFTRMGYVEVLFITEFIGLICIYAGYRMIKTAKQAMAIKIN